MEGIAIAIYLKEFWEYNSQLFWETVFYKKKKTYSVALETVGSKGSIRCGCYFAEFAIKT